jgi:transcriptional regulator GlxA family with amidase domain
VDDPVPYQFTFLPDPGTIGKIDNFGRVLAMDILVLALDGVFDTGLSVLADALAIANDLASMQGLDTVRFQVTVAGVRRKVRTAQGLTVPVRPLPDAVPDWVVVPALGAKMPAPLLQALGRPDVRDAVAALEHLAARGAQVGAACIGTFVLGESGLLDGQAATTTWWLAPLFRQRYPLVKLDETRMLVRSGNILTTGAGLSHVDLALWLVRQESPSLADLTARYLIVDQRPSQSAYAASDHLSHNDPVVARFEAWARDRLALGFSLEEAAASLATSKRTLARKLQDVLGKSPLAYFQDLRVERAVHLLRTSADDVERIAAQVGYADGVTLRALLRRRLGKGVRELRQG